MIYCVSYSYGKYGVINGYLHKNNAHDNYRMWRGHYLIVFGSLIFENNEEDYGYAEEFHEKLDYIIHRIEEIEERIE